MDDHSALGPSRAVAFLSQTTLGLSSLVVRACIRESKKRKVLMCLDVPYYYCTSRGAVAFGELRDFKVFSAAEHGTGHDFKTHEKNVLPKITKAFRKI